jgi:VWFA-related protein
MSCVQRFASSAPAALLAGIAALGAQGPPPQQPPRFAAATDTVIVDLLVTRDGRPIEGLTAGDFTVRDAGVPQKVEMVVTGSLPVRLLLALDASASVRGEALELLKQAAKAAVESLRASDEAAVLTFAHNVSLAGGWTSDRAELAKAIDAVTARGSTALADAAFTALGLAPKAGTRTLILLFTDGSDTASWLRPDQVLEAARRSEAVVYGVTAGAAIPLPPVDQLESWLQTEPSLYRGALLPVLARHTGGESMRVGDTKALRETFVTVVSRFNSRYVLTYSPSGAQSAGWHPIEVDVRGGGVVTARRGYYR